MSAPTQRDERRAVKRSAWLIAAVAVAIYGSYILWNFWRSTQGA
jgi:hypothetical protein